jgi:oligopeptide/dipeptide ABC transporter ATP-binding protein
VQIFDLLREIRRESRTAILLITHDLGTVAENADRVAIMHAGHIVEVGPTRAVFKSPRHPYTRALLASLPGFDRGQAADGALQGQAPDVFTLGESGCRFVARCPCAMSVCALERPPWVQVAAGHTVFCHLYRETPADG